LRFAHTREQKSHGSCDSSSTADVPLDVLTSPAAIDLNIGTGLAATTASTTAGVAGIAGGVAIDPAAAAAAAAQRAAINKRKSGGGSSSSAPGKRLKK
jgi:hypothetical protein